MNYLFIFCKGLCNAVVPSLGPSVMSVVRFYSDEAVGGRALQRAAKLCPQLVVSTELCYNVELTGERPAARRCITAQIWFSCKFYIKYPRCFFFPSHFLLQAPRVSALSRRRFSSGCFVLPFRRSRCLTPQNSPRGPAADWWRLDQGTRSRF